MEPLRVTNPKAKRPRWWQFTLRTFFLLLLLISLPLAWIGNEIASNRRDQELAAAIDDAGGNTWHTLVSRLNFPPFAGSSKDFEGHESWTQGFRITGVRLNSESPDEFRSLLARVKKLRHLDNLNFSSTCVVDSDLQGLEQLHDLTYLNLDATGVGDEGMDFLVRLPSLERISLDYTDVSNVGLVKLAALRSLKEISVTGTLVTPAGIARLLAQRPDLDVTCEGSFSHREEVRAVRELRRKFWGIYFLEETDVGMVTVSSGEGRTEVGESELASLQALTNLELSIYANAPKGIETALAKMDGLKSLWINNGIDGAGLRSLAECPNLERLNIVNNALLEDDLSSLHRFPRLKNLWLKSEMLTSRGIEIIARTKRLTDLSFHGGRFLKLSLVPLTELEGLDSLSIDVAQFEPDATGPLGELNRLKRLSLCGSNIDDENLAPLLQLPALETLDLGSTKISDKGLLRVAEIKSLKEVDVSGSDKVSDEGRKQFSQLRPDVKLKKIAAAPQRDSPTKPRDPGLGWVTPVGVQRGLLALYRRSPQ